VARKLQSGRNKPWKTLAVERQGQLARIWLNRPESRNALNQKILEEIADVFEQLQAEFEVKVVILGGRGKSFCAGADLKEPPGLARITKSKGVPVRERHWLSNLGNRALQAIEQLDAITIARIHGHAIGGGILLALACDLRIAADDTVFFFPEASLGNPLDWKGVPRLVHEIGLARARELVLLSQRLDAAQAETYGLLNRVAPLGQLDEISNDWAERLCGVPDVVLRMSKAQFRSYAAARNFGDATEFESSLLLEALRDERARSRFRRS
jgi:enoyl-CoA hydratase/carnithine racemase